MLVQRWKRIPNRFLERAATKDPSVFREYRQARRGEGANVGGGSDAGSFLQELDEIPAVFFLPSHINEDVIDAKTYTEPF